jgi:hypothetical protein
MFNRDVWRHGWPRRYFVKEIVGILNDEGYDVREFHQGKHTPEYLHEFYVEAVAPDGTGFGDVVIVRENNFARAKREARQKFEENTRERVKKTRWANDVIRIVDIHRKTYKLVESDYEVVEKEESGF